MAGPEGSNPLPFPEERLEILGANTTPNVRAERLHVSDEQLAVRSVDPADASDAAEAYAKEMYPGSSLDSPEFQAAYSDAYNEILNNN